MATQERAANASRLAAKARARAEVIAELNGHDVEPLMRRAELLNMLADNPVSAHEWAATVMEWAAEEYEADAPEADEELLPGDASSRWIFQDLTALTAVPVEPPQIAGLFYQSQRHVVSSEPDVGKTWLALWAAVGEMQAGYPVLWVNTDDMPRAEIQERMISLGATLPMVSELFLYSQPAAKMQQEDWEASARRARAGGIRLAVVDSFNSALSVQGLDPNSNPDVERFWREVASPLQRVGVGVVALDHLPKSQDNRGRYSFGSERKLSGANVHIGLRAKRPLARLDTGRVRLYSYKDRTGYLPKPIIGDFELTNVGDITTARIHPVTVTDTFRPTNLMEKVSRVLEEAHPQALSRNAALEMIEGKTDAKRVALDVLVEEGYVAREVKGQTWRHTFVKAFREDGSEGE